MKIKMSVARMVVTENISVQDPYSLATLYLKLEIESKRGEMHFRIAISIRCTGSDQCTSSHMLIWFLY